MHKPGDVILTNIQFTDTFEIKKRPAVILFCKHTNYIIAGITSNMHMEGIPLSREEGALKPCVIKTNYIFTVASFMIEKKLFRLSIIKRQKLYRECNEQLKQLVI